MTEFRYNVYGLSLASDRPIAGLPGVTTTTEPDVRITVAGPTDASFSAAPDTLLFNGVKAVGQQSHSLRVWASGDTLAVRYALQGEQIAFLIGPEGRSVHVAWSPDFPRDDMPAFLLGPVIGCVLRSRGVLALHAGCVAVGDGAIAIVGEKGAGKSTLVGTFARAGYPILSDDVAPIWLCQGQPYVQPGFPRLRLWPNTLNWLGLDYEVLPRVESIFEKRYLDLDTRQDAVAWRFCHQPRRLLAVYHLLPRSDASPFCITPVEGAHALNTLLTNSYADYVLDRVGRLSQFRSMARLERPVQVRAVQATQDIGQVEATCEAIVLDVKAAPISRET